MFGVTSKGILLQFGVPAELENLSIDTLAELHAKLSRRKLDADKANELSNAAKTSFGITFSAIALLSSSV